ncbi:hypothetical protein SH611_19140 [Geminicoccaceae bacterium 1502E]|nr:hypothetical protein [Geminicoccaceae bacterium 1502E]
MLEPRAGAAATAVTVDLTAVIVAVTSGDPRLLIVGGDGADRLPAGPLQPEHPTLQSGLRSWVEQQTRQKLGYVEQLYTFGDRCRTLSASGVERHHRSLSLAYLALVREARPAGGGTGLWRSWYEFFPWEDWRAGDPDARRIIVDRLLAWVQEAGHAEGRLRRERADLLFGLGEVAWDEERALERYELLYEAGLVAEAWHDRGQEPPFSIVGGPGRAMAADHRRILATAISRLRGKTKYRPVLFELMPPSFTLLQLQRTAEALSGVLLHKQNFRRIVENQRLVEETGEIDAETGGRPAKLVRFRHEVTLERPAPGLRLTTAKRGSPLTQGG